MKKIFCLAIFIISTAFMFAERPLVRDIQARPSGITSGNKVRITWKLPENPEPAINSLILYRTTEQISSFNQLSETQPLATLPPYVSEYVDTLADLKDYYYTVISLTDTVYDVVLLSFNSTVTGVHLSVKKPEEKKVDKADAETMYPDGKLRKTPLPFIDILEGSSAEPLVSSKTAESAMNTLSGNGGNFRKEKLTPYIFEDDLVSPDAGDDYLLYEILKNYFVVRNYTATIEKLNQLIGTNINENTQNRAYFYLGESQYFQGKYEEAVRSFIKVQQAFPTLSKKWIESSLDRI